MILTPLQKDRLVVHVGGRSVPAQGSDRRAKSAAIDHGPMRRSIGRQHQVSEVHLSDCLPLVWRPDVMIAESTAEEGPLGHRGVRSQI